MGSELTDGIEACSDAHPSAADRVRWPGGKRHARWSARLPAGRPKLSMNGCGHGGPDLPSSFAAAWRVETEAAHPAQPMQCPSAPGHHDHGGDEACTCRWWAGADASLGVEGSRAALTRRTGLSVLDARSPEGSRYSEEEEAQRSKCCLSSSAIGMNFSCCQALRRLVRGEELSPVLLAAPFRSGPDRGSCAVPEQPRSSRHVASRWSSAPWRCLLSMTAPADFATAPWS